MALWQQLEIGQHRAPIGFVAAIELLRIESDLLQYVYERAATTAAAPAVNQRVPGFGFVGKMGVEMSRDIAPHQRCTDFFGSKVGDLFVQRPHFNPFIVIQHRQIDRARNMVFEKFAGRARIDHFIEAAQIRHRGHA